MQRDRPEYIYINKVELDVIIENMTEISVLD